MDKETRTWAMFLHLSVLSGYVLPIAGLVVPVVIWQLKKSEMPELDEHGKVVTNFIISMVIYSFVCLLLTFLIIGIPLLIALSIVAIVFPIIGGIKASNGELWQYPLTIKFIK